MIKYILLTILLYSIVLVCSILCDNCIQIKRKYLRLLKPKMFGYKYVTKKEGEYIMPLVYEIKCDPPVDNDVVERRLTVSINGEVVSTDVYSHTTISFGEQSFVQGDNVTLKLIDVDDVGNMSEPAIVEFVANDTIAPSVPGLSVVLVREE